MILYYSCTGNSKHIAEIIANKYEEDTVCFNDDIKNGATGDFYSDIPYIIVSPIFNMRIPHELSAYLERSSFKGSNEVIYIAVCSYSSGNARGYVNNLFKAKKMRTFYSAVVMPSTNAFCRSKMSEKTRASVIQRAEAEALRLAHNIYNAEPIIQQSVSLVGLIGSALNPTIVKYHNDKKLKVDSSCDGCGICIEACNLNNIELIDGSVNFKHNSCNHCSACINKCPKQAIKVK